MLNVAQLSSLLPGRLRVWLLRFMGINVAEQAFVTHGVSFSGPAVTIARGAFINVGAVIEASAPVVLEAFVYVANGAMLVTATHDLGDAEKRAGRDIARPIHVGAGSWIGARALVLPGVTIAPGCVIGAGAVVTRNTERDGLYLGNPARRHRTLEGDSMEGEL
jgi:maltose O-acetyltransferase